MQEKVAVKQVSFRLDFIGINTGTPTGEEPEHRPVSFIFGDDPDQWVPDAETFAKLVYYEMYDGVDLEFLIGPDGLKYTYIAHPGGNPSDIRFRYEGVESTRIVDDGSIAVCAEGIEIWDSGLFIFQDINGRKQEVAGHFTISSSGDCGYSIDEDYDLSLPLYIDPLLYSTYVGGTGIERVWYDESMALDDEENVYLTGATTSTDFPTTPGVWDRVQSGYSDVFLFKLDPEGKDLLYSTYIGGTGGAGINMADKGWGMTLGVNGSVYLSGETTSNDFPTTTGAFNRNFAGAYDIFVLKLVDNGTSIEWSTLLGTPGDDSCRCLVLAENGSVWGTGTASGNGFPMTGTSYDSTHNGGYDCIMFGLNANGSKLLYATYIGTSSADHGTGLRFDSSGLICLAGSTGGNNFPVVPGSYQTTHGGSFDAFALRFNSTLTGFEYCTYLGGTGDDRCDGYELDDQDHPYLVGSAGSGFPTTAGALDTTFNGGWDAFLTKLDKNGTARIYSTYLGSSLTDVAVGIELDEYYNIYLTGPAGSGTFPTTQDAYDDTFNGNSDVFVSVVNSSGDKLLYSTFVGGSASENGAGIKFKDSSVLYIGGATESNNFPTVAGSNDTTYNGNFDAFVLKLSIDSLSPSIWNDSTPLSGTTGDPFEFNVTATDNHGVKVLMVEYWYGNSTTHLYTYLSLVSGLARNGTWTGSIVIPTDSLETFHYIVRAYDAAGNEYTATMKNVTILDNDMPWFIKDASQRSATTGDPFSFLTLVTDNIKVSRVWVNIRALGVNTSVDLVPEANGFWTLVVDAPSDAQSFEYTLYSVDGSGNQNNSVARSISIVDNDPPWLSVTNPPSHGFTGDPLNIYGNITDNWDIDEVWLEHWYGTSLNHTFSRMGAIGADEYLWTIHVQSHSNDTLHLLIRASDSSGNWNQSSVHDVQILDNDAPIFGTDLTPDNATTGDPVFFTILVTDNIEISSVMVVYTFHGSGSTSMLFMPPAPLGPPDAYTIGILAPSDSLAALDYKFSAIDSSLNPAETDWATVIIGDDDPPMLTSDTSHDRGFTGDLYRFSAVISDNIGVDRAQVEYWYAGEEVVHRLDMTRGTGDWSVSITVRPDSLAKLRYRFHMYDGTGNHNQTSDALVEVLDNDPPTFGPSDAEGPATTGEPLLIAVSVSDNILTSEVFLVYWFGASTGRNNVSMTSAPEDVWWVQVLIPHDSIEALHYRFEAVDNSSNWAVSNEGDLEVKDNDLPFIVEDLTPTIGYTGDAFTFEVRALDNVTVNIDLNVMVEYWFEDDPAKSPTRLEMPTAGTWQATITLPMGSVEPLVYVVMVFDEARNLNISAERTVEILDNDAPTMGPETTDGYIVKGWDHVFSVEVVDNVEVEQVYLVYRFGTASQLNRTMTGGPAFAVTVAVPRNVHGELVYHFAAVDTSGNWARLEGMELDIVNEAPILTVVPDWSLVEGEAGSLDLARYLWDPNDPVEALTVSSPDEHVDIDGFVLATTYDSWMPVHTLGVVVSDGEDSSAYNITVIVRNVNDPPVITSEPPRTATVGKEYRYVLTYTDEDPDDTHTIFDPLTDLLTRWGMVVDDSAIEEGEVTITWTPDETMHDWHLVAIAISDGEEMDDQRWSIKVLFEGEPTGNHAPYFVSEPILDARSRHQYQYDADALDDDGNHLVYHLIQGPDGMRMDNSTGLVTWDPPGGEKDLSKDYVVIIDVTDGYVAIRQNYTLRHRYPDNEGPIIQGPIPNIDTTGERSVDLTKYMYDPDDPVTNLTWEVVGGDEDMFVVRLDGNELTIIPRDDAQGQAALTLVLSDPSGAEDSQTLAVTVEPWVVKNASCLLMFLIIIIIVSFAIFYSWRRRTGVPDEKYPEGEVLAPVATSDDDLGVDLEPEPVVTTEPLDTDETEAEAAEATDVPAIVPAAVESPLTYIVEEVFVVYNDGRLMVECAREECKTQDGDLMSGMLIAIQGLIQDGLERGGALESIKYGDSLILMASGEHIHLAVVVFGSPDEELQETLRKTVSDIEASYAGVIERWTGELDVVSGIEGMVLPLVASTTHLTRDDVGGAAAAEGVSLVSAVDFHRGYVRLKVAAVNSTRDLIADASVEVIYDPDMLRLERVEPATFRLRGDRVKVGNVKPGERKTVAFLFDPQICQGTHIDGTMRFFDTRGEMTEVRMKRRHADVVCPIFFTQENANTAMLRRLIKDKLHQSDLRVFSYPLGMEPPEVLKVGKTAVGGGDIQLVREYVVPGPPYEAEVWYYGETKVKGFQMVMRLGVVEEKGAFEFFAASTAMEPITGLLAEFRRDLNRVMKERYVGEVRMEPQRDEDVRKELETRPLLLDRVGEGEIEPDEAI